MRLTDQKFHLFIYEESERKRKFKKHFSNKNVNVGMSITLSFISYLSDYTFPIKLYTLNNDNDI